MPITSAPIGRNRHRPYVNFSSSVTNPSLWWSHVIDVDRCAAVSSRWKSECTFTEYTPGGGTHLDKGYVDVRPLRPLFTLSHQFPKTPISACFSSLRPPFQQKSQIFTKFVILEHKFTTILVPKPQILQNFSSKARFQRLKLNLGPNSVLQGPIFFQKISSLSPYFSCPVL